MANIPILTATGGTAYLDATGAGTDGDPYVPVSAPVVSGTVTVGGTPTVTVADATIASGTVTVGNTVPVTLTSTTITAGTVAATQSGTWGVGVTSGTVVVTSGTVAATLASTTITSGTINVAGTATTTPAQKTMLWVTGTAAAEGTPIAAVSGSASILSAFEFSVNAGTASFVLKKGATAIWQTSPLVAPDTVAIVLPPGREWTSGNNTAWVLSPSGGTIAYSIAYYQEAAA